MSHSFTCRIMVQLPLSLVNRFQGVGKDSNFAKLFSLVFKHVSDYRPPNDGGSEPISFCRRQWRWLPSTFLHFVPSSNTRLYGRLFSQFWSSRILDQSPTSACSFINPLSTKININCFKWSQLGAHYFLVYLFQLLCVFRATICPSSGELTVSMRRWYFSLCLVRRLGWDCSLIPTCRPDSYPYRGGVVSLWRLKQCFSLHPDTTLPQPKHTVTPTHIEPEQYNSWNNSTNKSQAPEDGCINIRNMLSIK